MSADTEGLDYWRNRRDNLKEIPPWCYRQGILGTGPGSKDRSGIRCKFRESCGEVGRLKELIKYCSEMLSEFGITVSIQCLYHGEFVTLKQCRECGRCFTSSGGK